MVVSTALDKNCPETNFGGIDGGSSYKWYSYGADAVDDDLQIELRPLSVISGTDQLMSAFDNLVTIPSVITTKNGYQRRKVCFKS